MRYHESSEKAKQLKRSAFIFLEKYELSPNPINYAVAYEFVSNSNQKLNKQVQEQQSLDNYICELIFQDCILKDDSFDQTAMDNMDASIEKLGNYCNGSNQQIERYIDTLKTTQSQLTDSDTDSAVKLIDRLTSESQQMMRIQQSLMAEIEETKKHSRHLKQQFEQAQKQAFTDSLTGLYNRTGMQQQIDIWEQQNRTERLMAIVLDIDHFKRLNDEFGHLIGDVVLAKVAQKIKLHALESSLPVRYGGEEFLILIPDGNDDTAMEIAEDVRKAVNKMRFVSAKTKISLPPISVSIGVAKKRTNEILDTLINRADKAMYLAKNQGRNQVVHEAAIA